MNIQKIIGIVKKLREEAIANTVGGGHIAGTAEAGDDRRLEEERKHQKVMLDQEFLGYSI